MTTKMNTFALLSELCSAIIFIIVVSTVIPIVRIVYMRTEIVCAQNMWIFYSVKRPSERISLAEKLWYAKVHAHNIVFFYFFSLLLVFISHQNEKQNVKKKKWNEEIAHLSYTRPIFICCFIQKIKIKKKNPNETMYLSEKYSEKLMRPRKTITIACNHYQTKLTMKIISDEPPRAFMMQINVLRKEWTNKRAKRCTIIIIIIILCFVIARARQWESKFEFVSYARAHIHNNRHDTIATCFELR